MNVTRLNSLLVPGSAGSVAKECGCSARGRTVVFVVVTVLLFRYKMECILALDVCPPRTPIPTVMHFVVVSVVCIAAGRLMAVMETQLKNAEISGASNR